MTTPPTGTGPDPDGTKAAFVREALARHEGPLLLYAGRMLRDTERARDVVQEVFLRLCSQDPAELEGHLTAWLYTVCRRRALDVLRKEKPMRSQPTATLDEGESPGPRPAAAMEQRETQSVVLHELESLPEEQHEAIRLKFQAGLSYKEIAEVMGIGAGYVGYLIHTGLKTLRGRLAAREVTP